MLENRKFFPEVFQAVAGKNHTVYAYMNDGSIRHVDIKPYLEGSVFKPLLDPEIFQKTLTVIGHTVAWDLKGDRDEYECIDIDPFYVQSSPKVNEPLDLA